MIRSKKISCYLYLPTHQIISHKKDSWPSYARFLHFWPFNAVLTQQLVSLNAPVWIVRKIDSSALLVMKAHQQNTWKPFIFRSLDFCHAVTVPQDQKASLLQSGEFDWLVKGQKRAQGIGSEGLL